MANQQQFFFMEAQAVEGCAKTDCSDRAAVEQPASSPTTSANPQISATQVSGGSPRDLSADLRPVEVSLRPTGALSADAPEIDAAEVDAAPPSRDAVLRSLRAKVGCVTTPRQDGGAAFSTGCDAIDSWLPTGGLHPAALTQWIAAHDSAAAGSLAMSAAAHRLRQTPNRPLVIVDCQGTFYPPAAVSLGVPHERIILLRPRSGADAIWAIDQSLRSGAVAAVWASLPMQIDDRDARRLQLAAETGRTPGLLVRGFAARGKPSFAEVQFYVSQQKRQVMAERRDFEIISVTLDRVRGGVVGQQLDVQIDDRAIIFPISSSRTNPHDTRRHETAAKHLASQLANPKTAQRAARRRSRTAS